MANEFRHGTVGTALSQAEWESITGHSFASQATGDILYASSTTQLSRLAKGTDGDILNLASNIPAWTSTITTNKTFNDDISILFGTSGADATLKSDGTNLVLNLLATSNFVIQDATANVITLDSTGNTIDFHRDLDFQLGATIRTSTGNLTITPASGIILTHASASTVNVNAPSGNIQFRLQENGTWKYVLGYNVSSNYFHLRSTDTDGSGTDADIIRIPDGQTTVDGNTTFDINVFDDYDDAMVLYRAYSPEHRTVYESGKQILRENRQELINMGILNVYDDGWVGYNDQRMSALLAGGIYQTRFRVDEQQAEINKIKNKINELQTQITQLEEVK